MSKVSTDREPNPLICPSCGEYRYLIIEGVRFEAPVNRKVGLKVAFFQCDKCGLRDPVRPGDEVRAFAERMLKEQTEDGEFTAFKSKADGRTFPAFDGLELNYNSQDYYYIPGLLRPSEDGYLTPVFFDPDLLLYYNNHSKFRVVQTSFTSVDILDHEGMQLVPHGFGINRMGNIFAWLGDLHNVFCDGQLKNELLRFRASNIDSDHDVVSHFYFSEIEAEFTEPDNEFRIFHLKNEFEKKVKEQHNLELSKVNFENLPSDYRQPVIDEIIQVFDVFTMLNSALVETIQKRALSKVLINSGVPSKEIKGLGGLKLLERFLSAILRMDDAPSLVSPLFVLNDLRGLDSHLKSSSFDQIYEDCKRRLDCDINTGYLDTYNALITAISNMYQELNDRLAVDA